MLFRTQCRTCVWRKAEHQGLGWCVHVSESHSGAPVTPWELSSCVCPGTDLSVEGTSELREGALLQTPLGALRAGPFPLPTPPSPSSWSCRAGSWERGRRGHPVLYLSGGELTSLLEFQMLYDLT